MIDLHLHTTASDGRCSPRELTERAARGGVLVMAVTDHDTTAAVGEVRAEARARNPELSRSYERYVTELGLARLVSGAREHLPGFKRPAHWQPTHDQLDALFCALTARLHAAGQTQALGDPSEVPIIIPRL